MLYDAETRILIAREHSAVLRSEAEHVRRDRRARRWLGDRLIDAGLRLAPERATAGRAVRSATA